MNYQLVVLPTVQTDIEEAALWYNNQRKGLGAELLLSIEAEINLIARNPYTYQVSKKDYRRALIHKFPYNIFYKIDNDKVVILALWHFKRKPFSWLKRV